MIITIGGLAGSGTTTVAKILSEKMNVPYISAGDIFRQMAKEKGMDILEFSAFAENNVNVDQEIDKRQAAIAKEKDNLIVEGRLSAFFVDAHLKIWFTAPLDVRARRICRRENKTFDVVKKEILTREESEAKRYEDIHDIDIKNLDLYDFIINTNRFKAENIADIILKVTEVILCQQ